MRLRLILFAMFSGAFALAPTASALDYPERTWTNDKGETIEARLLRQSSTTAMLRQNGENIRAPIDRLSEADQAWLEVAKTLGKFREWTMASGAKRKARLSHFDDGRLKIKENGAVIELSLNDLSTADQQLIATVFQGQTDTLTSTSTPLPNEDFTPDEFAARDWTNINGKTILAEFRGMEGDKIVLFYKDREWRVPLWRFSADDKQFVAAARNTAQNPQPMLAGNNAASNISATYAPPGQSESANRALETAREQQARLEREAQERARQQQERMAQMERDRLERERQQQELLAEQQRQREEQQRLEQEAFTNKDPSAFESDDYDSYGPGAAGMWINEYVCYECNHTWESTKELGVNDKCPNCGVTFDYVEDENGDVVESSPRRYRRLIRLVIFVVLAAGGAVAKMSRG